MIACIPSTQDGSRCVIGYSWRSLRPFRLPYLQVGQGWVVSKGVGSDWRIGQGVMISAAMRRVASDRMIHSPRRAKTFCSVPWRSCSSTIVPFDPHASRASTLVDSTLQRAMPCRARNQNCRQVARPGPERGVVAVDLAERANARHQMRLKSVSKPISAQVLTASTKTVNVLSFETPRNADWTWTWSN